MAHAFNYFVQTVSKEENHAYNFYARIDPISGRGNFYEDDGEAADWPDAAL
jgi:hypothetical protein